MATRACKFLLGATAGLAYSALLTRPKCFAAAAGFSDTDSCWAGAPTGVTWLLFNNPNLPKQPIWPGQQSQLLLKLNKIRHVVQYNAAGSLNELVA